MPKSMNSVLPPIVLQAGGKGERMAGACRGLPKVLVPVQGVALIERLIRQIAAEGAREFYIITGHAGHEVEAHVLGIKGLPSDLVIEFVRETGPRGNIGSITEMAYLNETVLFAFGDLFTNLSFRTLFQIHRQRNTAITLASHLEPHRLQLGHLIVQNETVMDYREKPEYSFLICSGIAAIEPEVLRQLPATGSIGMNRMVLTALEKGHTVSHWTHGAFWMDVNTPALLEIANSVEIKTHAASEYSLAAGAG